MPMKIILSTEHIFTVPQQVAGVFSKVVEELAGPDADPSEYVLAFANVEDDVVQNLIDWALHRAENASDTHDTMTAWDSQFFNKIVSDYLPKMWYLGKFLKFEELCSAIEHYLSKMERENWQEVLEQLDERNVSILLFLKH